ncbi:putative metal-dependent hydrolase [Sinobacterium caligoides]|uniref:Putative metal-dependent hydrolase n=1 Tax=Sinobacterium caligoides TaxID=933926 RepID=A0A3N2DDT8_9GAMM|nr:metal-dependent hydrolase [Sinobacterium caligoides]ROR97955.1 putative metal-dependent hydrolase [Sinobacterium caligoides]
MKSKKINIDIDAIEKNWCEDDFYRIFYNILNAGIPPFERYVIKTMREVRDDPRLDDEPRIRELVDIFVRQEIEHTKMHIPVNRKIGLDKIKAGKFTEKITRFIQRRTPLYVSVASCAFIEFVGFGFFKSHIDKDVLYSSGMHEEMAKLWKWHTAEELEHSFVKLKVINHINNAYWLKLWGMIEGVIVAHLFVTVLIPEIVWQDAKAQNKRFLPHLWMFFKGLAKTEWGVNRHSVGQYFRKDFDPEIKQPWVAEVVEKWVAESGAR